MSWIFCIIVFGLQFLVAMLLQIGKRKTQVIQEGGQVSEITVIIPFHNEGKRISKLISSLNSAVFNPSFELIFVDDHSTDGTSKILADELKIPFTCIKNEDKKGKKYAIRSGVLKAKHDYIVTWDADISIPNEYFNAIGRLTKADLNILPIKMNGKNLLGKLSNVEFTFLETLGFGLAGFGQLVLCYGANLGFRKDAFLVVDETRTDYDTPSGDDLFLLRAMELNGKIIRASSHENVQVISPAASSFKELLQQRQRWFGKMGKLLKPRSIFPLALLIAAQVAFVLCVVLSFVNPFFLVLLVIKFAAEMIASWSFVKQNGLHILVLLIHQFWYPVFCLLLFFPIKKEDRWQN